MKLSDEQRRRLFWSACIPLRLILGVLALFATLPASRRAASLVVGTASLVGAAGFLIFATALRHRERGVLGGPVWWTRSRLVHLVLWLACGALCVADVRGAGLLLVVDALVGAVAGLWHFGVR